MSLALVRKLAVAGALVPLAALVLQAAPASAAPYGHHRDGYGYGNAVNARQGDQQARIAHGVRDGRLTPGEVRNLENREDRISNRAVADRAANGGRLTRAERERIEARQNRLSRSIYHDDHNRYNDENAALRNGSTFGGERRDAGDVERRDRPHGPRYR